MLNKTVLPTTKLNILKIDVSEVANHPTTLQDLFFHGTLQAVIIRKVFSQEALEQVSRNLETNSRMQSILIKHGTSDYKIPYVYGHSLVSSPSDLKDYLTYAEIFREGFRELFEGNPDFEEQVFSILQTLGGGVPVEIPTAPNGKSYQPVGIRFMPAGHEIKIHAGLDFLNGPGPKHLRSFVDVSNQLSYFMPITNPEAGGELVMFNLRWSPELKSFKPLTVSEVRQDRVIYNREESDCVPEELTDAALEKYESQVLELEPGDLLVFDGGRYYHKVTPVVGNKIRQTVGGFLSFSSKGNKVYLWS